MRQRLPNYLVRAIDYVTGGYVPGAPAFPADAADAEHEDGEVGVAGDDAAGA